MATFLQRFLSALYGFGVIAAAFWLACLLRFDFAIPRQDRWVLFEGLIIATLVKGLTFRARGLHVERCERYVTFSDFLGLAEANFLGSALSFGVIWIATNGEFPRSIYLLDLLVCLPLSGLLPFAASTYGEVTAMLDRRRVGKGLLIYGAGVAGVALAKEIRDNSKLGYRVLGFLDDDLRKQETTVLGLPVLGTGDQAPEVVAKFRDHLPPVSEIVVAMPSATGRQIRSAQARGQAAGVPCRIVPGLGELISGKLPLRATNALSVTDLLGREPVHLSQEAVSRSIRGHCVLVTGAAGSIGSELCDQLARLGPKRLVVLDQAESEMFRLEADLRGRYPNLDLAAEIGDVRDPHRLDEIMKVFEVESIFHAAAYKHVSLMERHVCEAVRNNVLGTWNLTQAAWRNNVAHLVLISSDKAVNPSGVMGLTKRVAELIVSADRAPVGNGHPTKFSCVRFGNVLVSNGSVVPIFQKQIAGGGPVTVTHPDVRRYFMTVQEAVQLVLEASTMGEKSEIYVLDMGQPMRILDLANKMIGMAGLTPGSDIEIKFTGLKPGEKMFEEINVDAEDLLPTSHDKIRVFRSRKIAFERLVPWIAELQHLLWRRDPHDVLEHLRILAPEYTPAGHETPAAATVNTQMSETAQAC